ncbi:hypothetical protein IFM89_027709 [Coptis chinensis]|uniref:39S ribosomal protein L46, mitochondrial n=1 Tax=Coptis chinensis TaxID=261450 RepID=A0A835HTI1_9MAGN|nr:hypothetical protein IFM89_027709 [Coptis chinensis]
MICNLKTNFYTGEKVTTKLTLYPAPRVTEADKKNDRRSLQRALDRRLYLLLYEEEEEEKKKKRHFVNANANTSKWEVRGKGVQMQPIAPNQTEHEETLRKVKVHYCLLVSFDFLFFFFPILYFQVLTLYIASALKSVLGDLSYTYFVGNAPMGHMVIQPTDDMPDTPSFKRFFFKSQVIATNKFRIGKSEDHVWVTKDELTEYFPEQAAFLDKMIIS